MAKWTRETVEGTLTSNGLSFSSRDIANGVQYVLEGGTPIDLYESTGKVVVRGKESDERRTASLLFAGDTAPSKSKQRQNTVSRPTARSPMDDPKVFIVYGHDTKARDELELLLLRMNIKPVILSNLAPEGKTIIEALMANTNVKYAVALLTPDGEGHKRDHPEEKKYRARQNVVLELGRFLAALGREKVAILHKGELELPSDIDGLIWIPFGASVQDAKNKLAASLQKAGFYIDIETLSAG